MRTIEIIETTGYPEEISQELELPDIAELLVMPMFNNVDGHELYKRGNDFHRYLLDNTPIRNTRKYVTVKSFVQFLYPGIGACDIKINPKFQDEWHIDYDIRGNDAYWHILSSQCTSLTEFHTKPLTVITDGIHSVREILNEKAEEWGLEPRKIPAKRVVTFTSHVHRPSPPLKPEFRYFWRVQETDYLEPKSYDEARMMSDGSFNGMSVHRNGVNIRNLEHTKEGIKIHYPWSE